MILAIKTDTGTAELTLCDAAGEVIAREDWQADRTLARDLLGHLEALLQNYAWSDLTGLVVFKGPGSFTGLRIGITVMNSIAYAERIPIVGVMGEAWLHEGIKRLQNNENDEIVLPEYGAPPRITQPKK